MRRKCVFLAHRDADRHDGVFEPFSLAPWPSRRNRLNHPHWQGICPYAPAWGIFSAIGSLANRCYGSPMSLAARWIPGGWTEQTLDVGGRAYSLLLPASPDDVLYYLEQHPDAAQTLGLDPYWAQLWPTSERLAASVAQESWSSESRAIELGCGIGLVGLAALASGMRVTFTDYNPLAVELALENARRNKLDARAEGQVVDWRDPPDRKFDVILGSDLIYDRELHVPLMQTIERLANQDATIWIADGGRRATEEFFLLARKRWRIDLQDLENRPASDIRIGEYRRMICHLPH